MFSNPSIGLWLNDYAFIEDHEQGNGYAYVVSAPLTIRQGLYKNKEKVTFKVAARDGSPWCYGCDYTVADRGLFEIDGIYYAEQIRKAKWSYDDPFAAGMKALADGWNAIGSLYRRGGDHNVASGSGVFGVDRKTRNRTFYGRSVSRFSTSAASRGPGSFSMSEAGESARDVMPLLGCGSDWRSPPPSKRARVAAGLQRPHPFQGQH